MIPEVDVAALLAEPHGQFRALRAQHPVVQIMPGLYLVLRHADVLAAASDPALHQMQGADYVALAGIPRGPVAEFLTRIMVFDASAGHLVKRRPFNTALSFPKVDTMRAKIQGIAKAHVDDLPVGTPFDLVSALSARLPTAVICGILGFETDGPERAWILARVEILSKSLAPIYPMEEHGEIEAAVVDLTAHVSKALAARQSARRDDLLTALLSTRGDLRLDDLVMQIVGMLMAGSDTTRSALAVAASYLLADWGTYDADPEPAIWEALRLDAPVGTLPLWTDADWPVPGGGGVVPGGSMVGLSTLSAMRDPAVFPDPDTFKADRAPPRDLVFGKGAHRCMGSRIAMIEIEETLRALHRRFARFDIPAPARMQGFGGIRRADPFVITGYEGPP